MLSEEKLDEIRALPGLQILLQIPSDALHRIVLGFHVSGFIKKNSK
jgi:hypothetical protein